MKILMVSIFSPHFFNWTEQLKNSGHEIYWLDVFDSNTQVKQINFVHHITGWRYKWNYPGRYTIKKNLPQLNKFISKFNERKLHDVFEKTVRDIKPHVVQSFVMYSACVPILEVMNNYRNILWIYSAWGNDLYYYQHKEDYLKGIKAVMPRLNYMFADCSRDYGIAKKYGFSGNYLGTFPGGGGYDFSSYIPLIKEKNERSTLLIKGYEHKFGRCNSVLQALIKIMPKLTSFDIIVFGANKAVFDFVKTAKVLNEAENLRILGKVNHTEVLKLMGQSLIYIGNSISDGTPNTLLEAVIMGVFPIQSDPGGATSEMIESGKNGLLIKNPENSDEIAALIQKALDEPEMLELAIQYNNLFIKPQLGREFIKKQVLSKYRSVEQEIE